MDFRCRENEAEVVWYLLRKKQKKNHLEWGWRLNEQHIKARTIGKKSGTIEMIQKLNLSFQVRREGWGWTNICQSRFILSRCYVCERDSQWHKWGGNIQNRKLIEIKLTHSAPQPRSTNKEITEISIFPLHMYAQEHSTLTSHREKSIWDPCSP